MLRRQLAGLLLAAQWTLCPASGLDRAAAGQAVWVRLVGAVARQVFSGAGQLIGDGVVGELQGAA